MRRRLCLCVNSHPDPGSSLLPVIYSYSSSRVCVPLSCLLLRCSEIRSNHSFYYKALLCPPTHFTRFPSFHRPFAHPKTVDGKLRWRLFNLYPTLSTLPGRWRKAWAIHNKQSQMPRNETSLRGHLPAVVTIVPHTIVPHACETHVPANKPTCVLQWTIFSALEEVIYCACPY